MLDWSFYEYECLSRLIVLLLDEDSSRSNDALDDLYNMDDADLLKPLEVLDDFSDLCSLVEIGLKKGNIKTQDQYKESYLSYKNFDKLYVEPVSFFKWVKKHDYKVCYSVECNVRQRERQLRIKGYKGYKITVDEVEALLREPLWKVSNAIMYLHGYKPNNDDRLDNYRSLNDEIVSSDNEMKVIREYLFDADKLGDIKVKYRSEDKVKPDDFMLWAENLKIDFPNLVTLKKSKENKVLHTRERDTLLKLIIGMAVEQYGYDPKAKRNEATAHIRSDLESCGISMDADTILNKLREASELLPPQEEL